MSTAFAIFAGVFVVYIVLDWGMDITGRKGRSSGTEAQNVGEINGTPITYKEFTDLVKNAADNQKKQTGQDPDETQLRTIRDQVWNQLIDENLYKETADRLGIKVTDQEIVDWVYGDDPPTFLKQQFTDSTGTFQRAVYVKTLQDPKNRSILITVENYLREQRLREKVQSVILSSVRVTDEDVMEKYLDQYTKYDGDYLYFDPNVFIKDAEVKVTDDDLRKYYNEHSAEFKIDPTRKVKYTLFPEVASGADSDAIVSELNDILSRAKAGADFSELAKTYSENPPAEGFIKHGELSATREEAVFAANVGDYVGPIKESDGYHLMRVDSEKTGTDEFLRVSHILISVEKNDSVAALKKAKDIVARLKAGADFAQIARTESKDPGSGAKGGDLGWFGKGRMVKPFEEAAFKAKIGQIVGPVRTQFGYHIIKVVAKDNRELKLTDLVMPVHPSPQTRDAITQQAQDFAYLAKEDGFEKEAKELNYSVQESQPFSKGTFISGIGINNTLSKFAFSNKVGKVSDVIGLQSGSCVAMVSDVNDAGMKPFDDVKGQILAEVRHDLKMAKLKDVVATLRKTLAPADSLSKLNGVQRNLSVQHLSQFTPSGFLPGIGRDEGFVGGISNLPVGQISAPIAGTRGYYIVKLSGKTPFDSMMFKSQAASIRQQLLSDQRNRMLSTWTDDMKKNSDIVDNRDFYFR